MKMAKLSGFALVVAAALLIGPAPVSADICVDSTEAVETWITDMLPQAGGYPDERICKQACSRWASGCRQIANAAQRCQRTESMAENSFFSVSCRGLDSDTRKLCNSLISEKKKTESAEIRSEYTDSRGGCSAGQSLCNARCESFFSDD
jgi:hypothetical protein